MLWGAFRWHGISPLLSLEGGANQYKKVNGLFYDATFLSVTELLSMKLNLKKPY